MAEKKHTDMLYVSQAGGRCQYHAEAVHTEYDIVSKLEVPDCMYAYSQSKNFQK